MIRPERRSPPWGLARASPCSCHDGTHLIAAVSALYGALRRLVPMTQDAMSQATALPSRSRASSGQPGRSRDPCRLWFLKT